MSTEYWIGLLVVAWAVGWLCCWGFQYGWDQLEQRKDRPSGR